MATPATIIPFDEYMQTSYSPDCEYVDGAIVERNVGKGKHAFTQGKIYLKLSEQALSKRLIVLPEQRVRVSPARVRIPDICIVEQLEEIITKPPLLCVEVLSPDDRWPRVNASVADYQMMGVPCVWLIHPYESRAWMFDLENPPMEIFDGRLTVSSLGIEVHLRDVLHMKDE